MIGAIVVIMVMLITMVGVDDDGEDVFVMDDEGDHDGNDGLPAYSHHDRFPPWWVFVRDDNGGNLSGDKIPPLMMIIINHLTQFNSSH